MINFSQTSEQIAEEIISYYKESTKFFLGYLSEKKHIELAIDKVTDLLQVCSEWDYRQNSSKHAVLKSVVEILNSKLKLD